MQSIQFFLGRSESQRILEGLIQLYEFEDLSEVHDSEMPKNIISMRYGTNSPAANQTAIPYEAADFIFRYAGYVSRKPFLSF